MDKKRTDARGVNCRVKEGCGFYSPFGVVVTASVTIIVTASVTASVTTKQRGAKTPATGSGQSFWPLYEPIGLVTDQLRIDAKGTLQGALNLRRSVVILPEPASGGLNELDKGWDIVKRCQA